MRFALILSTVLLGSAALAVPDPEILKSVLESQPDCGGVVRFDDAHLYQGFAFAGRESRAGKLRVSPLNGEPSFEITTADFVLDVVVDGSTAFLLTPSGIEEWDLATKARIAKHATYAITAPFGNKEAPESFARAGDLLIIAHGRLGVSFFNIKTKRLVNQFRLVRGQLPLESMATGVTVEGARAYVVMDNFHLVKPPAPPPLRGIVVIDLNSQKIVGEFGGMDPGADSIVSEGGKLLVSFGGSALWKYGASSLSGRVLPEPQIRVWKYPVKGHPTGTASVDAKYYYTCFLKAPAAGGGYFKNVPMALDRRVLRLD